MNNGRDSNINKYDKNDKKKAQSTPMKPKKRNIKLTAEDKTRIAQYNKDLEDFYHKNDERESKPKYQCNYNEEHKYYYIIEYDYQTFESFGVIIDKELRLTSTEVWYLNQIGLIGLNGFELNLSNENLNLFHLYSYLRRSSKIVTMNELISKDYSNYLFVYETINDFKEKLPSSLIFQYISNQISYTAFSTVLSTASKLFTLASIKNKDSCPISIAFCSGINITFITINEEEVSFI